MERVVGNPAIPMRGRERGGFDNSPNWEKSGSADLRVGFVDGCLILSFTLHVWLIRKSFVHLFSVLFEFLIFVAT